MKLPSFGMIATVLAISAIGYFLIFPRLGGAVASATAPKA